MGRLHIAPGDSAGGSLEKALELAGRSEPVLRFRDDLSCGPIDPAEPAVRQAWWETMYESPEVEGELKEFWHRIAATEERLVFWFARHSASELANFLSFADRMERRTFDIVDVTGFQWSFTRRDGTPGSGGPAQAASLIPETYLVALIDSERPFADREKDEAIRHWRKLRSENAPLRVVTPEGLASAPVDHFDPILLESASREWQRTARVVGEALARTYEPYYQVGDLVLLARVVALVEAGKLIAEGDPWHMQASRVRLPD